MHPAGDLLRALRPLDGRSYGAYKSLRGAWEIDGATLFIDHVQGDPFAAPSRARLRVAADAAGWPENLLASRERRIAFEDYLARAAHRAIERVVAGGRGSGRSGRVVVDAGRQTILERSAARANAGFVELTLELGLPASGRRILALEAEALLTEELPALADAALHATASTAAEAVLHADTAENHAGLQAQLRERELVAFVPDGARLARASGASDAPLEHAAVAFESPAGLRTTLALLHPVDGKTTLSGMGIPRGVTLIVGGGYHGKSTLLKAIERAVFPHVPADGRECVATLPSAARIRAEEGRRVVGCDIHAFIGDLPGGASTRAFRSENASGSTSQAANIIEAIEVGAELLLLDEDTSASNFMVRDARMQALVAMDHEPITAFVDRVRALYEAFGVSTVLVMGSSGDYFDVADTVIEMREYRPRDVTERAAAIVRALPTDRRAETRDELAPAAPRVPIAASLDPGKGRRAVRVEARGTDELVFGHETIDLRAVEPLVEPSQLRAIGYALAAARRYMGNGATLAGILAELDGWLDREGIEALDDRSNLARPRGFEIAAALCRLRSLEVEKSTGR